MTPSDRALRNRVFVIDPAQLTDLLEAPPETDEVPEIEYAYDVTPPKGRAGGHAPHLECVYSHGARHWKGFIVRWPSFGRARLGSTCGKDHFDFAFVEAEKRFGEQRSRQADLMRLEQLREIVPRVLAELRPLYRDPAVTLFDDMRLQFKASFETLWEALSIIARSSGRLRTEWRERDVEAAMDRAERSDEGRKLLGAVREAAGQSKGALQAAKKRLDRWARQQPAVMRDKSKDHGLIAGREFLTNPATLQLGLIQSARILAKLSDEITSNRSDYWSTAKAFSRTSRELREVVALVDGADRQLTQGRQFSSEANLFRIADWTQTEQNARRSSTLRPVESQGRLLINPATQTTWTFPSAAKFPALPALEELRRVLGPG